MYYRANSDWVTNVKILLNPVSQKSCIALLNMISHSYYVIYPTRLNKSAFLSYYNFRTIEHSLETCLFTMMSSYTLFRTALMVVTLEIYGWLNRKLWSVKANYIQIDSPPNGQ